MGRHESINGVFVRKQQFKLRADFLESRSVLDDSVNQNQLRSCQPGLKCPTVWRVAGLTSKTMPLRLAHHLIAQDMAQHLDAVFADLRRADVEHVEPIRDGRQHELADAVVGDRVVVDVELAQRSQERRMGEGVEAIISHEGAAQVQAVGVLQERRIGQAGDAIVAKFLGR